MAAVLLLAVAAVCADENEEVAKLYRQGNLAKALEQADAYLAGKPRDAQMRFNKGLILTEQKKVPDAIRIFSSLSEDYPDLPEPYNNLAVLYASQGQYEKARDALEAAIRTHPSYSTAHENLGRYLCKNGKPGIWKGIATGQGKRRCPDQARDDQGFVYGQTQKRKPRQQPFPSSPAPAFNAPGKRTGKNAGKTPEPKAAGEKAEKPYRKNPEKIAVAEKPEQGKLLCSDDSDEVIRTLNAWAKAWSDKDVAAYLAFYASDFRPPGGASRSCMGKNTP